MELSDYLAVSEAKGDGVFGGNGFLWVILIFLFFLAFNGNGIFGGNGGMSQVERDVLTTSCATQREVLDSRYTTQLGFQEAQAQMADCCCSIKTAIHAEGEMTRSLIQENIIQNLRDEVAGYRETLSNANQSQNILNAIGRFVVNPSTPYYYGTYYSGTTI